MLDINNKERVGDWIQTFTGKQFFTLDPHEDDEDDDDEEADINVKYEGFFDQPANKFGARKNEPKIEPAKNSKRAKAKAELAKRIAELEAEAINDKPWELKGEAKASARPKDSLLQKEDLDVAS